MRSYLIRKAWYMCTLVVCLLLSVKPQLLVSGLRLKMIITVPHGCRQAEFRQRPLHSRNLAMSLVYQRKAQPGLPWPILHRTTLVATRDAETLAEFKLF